jgi:hypothetical protein
MPSGLLVPDGQANRFSTPVGDHHDVRPNSLHRHDKTDHDGKAATDAD